MKKTVSLAVVMISLLQLCTGCMQKVNDKDVAAKSGIYAEYPNAKVVSLFEDTAAIDGQKLVEYEYTWSFNPSMEAPQYSGATPDTEDCYIAHDIIYYPEIDKEKFTKEQYDGETEWVTHYTAEGLTEYLFSTLPVLGEDLPETMMHSAEEAYANPVLHITQPGEYILEGTWNGQIYIDLGDKAACGVDESKQVTLIFNGANITCTVAPAVVFYSVYECDTEGANRTDPLDEIDFTNAGAKVVIADGTENNVSGANVYRLLMPSYKNDTTKVQKKLCKMDGAFYSFASLLMKGKTGILNITGTTYEGLDSELHLTIDGGYINIVSQDDGINVNEDHVSIFTLRDGRVTIFAGQGAEGDVVDSNGYINILGGIIAGASPSVSDNMLDSEDGTYVDDAATVIANVAGIQGGMGRPGGMQGGMGRPDGMQGGTFDPEIMGRPDLDAFPWNKPGEDRERGDDMRFSEFENSEFPRDNNGSGDRIVAR